MSVRKCIADGCDNAIGRKNRSGYCRAHFKHALPPDQGDRVSRALKKMYAHDPVAKERARATATANLFLPHTVAARRAAARRIGLAALGAPLARTPEARAKAARSWSNRCLAWCPPELRDEYRRLMRRAGMTRTEAKRIILEHHETDMTRFRRRIGAQPAGSAM